MSSSTTATQEMSRSHVSNLLYILRRANAHYSLVAAAVRNSLRPTHHARKRARSLKLKVSIEAALKLDPKQISTIPLPVIERVVTPPPPPQVLALPPKNPRRPTLRCDIPQNIHPDEMLSSMSTYSNVALTPASSVEARAPMVLRGQNVPWRPVTSRWSASTEEEEEENVVYSSDYEEGMDLPTSAEAEEEDIAFGLSSRPQVSKVGRSPPRLLVPVDISRLGWESDMPSGLSSGPSSRSSSSSMAGPVTPANYEELPKLTICIKRKSIASDIDMEDDTLEKRPKYDRKPWVNPAMKRPVHKMPATRRF